MINRLYIRANSQQLTPTDLVSEFLYLNKSWFTDKNNMLFNMGEICRVHLSVWAKNCYFPDDYGNNEIIYIQQKFSEYLDNFRVDTGVE